MGKDLINIKKDKELVDYDLDMLNVMKDFPKDNENCYVYMRGNKEGKESYVKFCGEETNIGYMIMAMMGNEPQARTVIANAFLNYMSVDKEFCKQIKDIVKKL